MCPSGGSQRGGVYGASPEAAAGAVGGCFSGAGAGIGGVESELVGGPGCGPQVVGAEGVAADPGALQAEGCEDPEPGVGQCG